MKLHATIPLQQLTGWSQVLDQYYDWTRDSVCEYHRRPICNCPGCELQDQFRAVLCEINDLIVKETNDATDT